SQPGLPPPARRSTTPCRSGNRTMSQARRRLQPAGAEDGARASPTPQQRAVEDRRAASLESAARAKVAEDAERLREALTEGEKAGVGEEALGPLRSLLGGWEQQALRQQAAALGALAEAATGGDAGRLRACVEAAEVACSAKDPQVVEARQCLSRLERLEVARRRLEEAVSIQRPAAQSAGLCSGRGAMASECYSEVCKTASVASTTDCPKGFKVDVVGMASAYNSEVRKTVSVDGDTDCSEGFNLDVMGLATDESDCAASFKTTSLDSLTKVQLDGGVDEQPEPGEDEPDAAWDSLADGDKAAALERWRERREDRRGRLAKQRAGFDSRAHACFCQMLCSSDCRHHSGDK
ncbi:unnamed protein product, partial [Prorocentrum cordatum]